MKRCKDCKWFLKKPNKCWKDHCWRFGRLGGRVIDRMCYTRKWWKFWRKK